MKHFSLVASSLLFLAAAGSWLRAAETPELSDSLKPLLPMVGAWKVRTTDPGGQIISGKLTFTPELGGKTVSMKLELLAADGTPMFSRLSIMHWQAESQTIAGVDFDSMGWHGSMILVKSDSQKFIWQGHGISGEAKSGTSVTELTKVDADTWKGQFVHVVYAGAAMPDSPLFTLTRVK